MPTLKELLPNFRNFVGEEVQTNVYKYIDLRLFEKGNGLGYSQFNEVLLLLGYDRICESLFQFLISGELEYKLGASFKTAVELEQGINRFIVLALLFYGSIKIAFKELSNNPKELKKKVESTELIKKDQYQERHDPINEIVEIPENKTYLLGYISGDKIKQQLKQNPKGRSALAKKKERESVIEIGIRNQEAYLSSDHLDVYIATSMREEHEYIFTNRIIKNIFNRNIVQDLKLRWFDPTQAYCDNRIDKGLSEALMLRRARCTIYLVQENDTLGKDSELASTLAQGKPVIAFVPTGDKAYVDDLIKNLRQFNSDRSEELIMLDQLMIFDPKLAWTDERINRWASNPQEIESKELRSVLYKKIKEHYDNRATTLKERHPLGIQVNLYSGVANGVLVVRNEHACAKLLHSIMLNNMDLYLEEQTHRGMRYIYLKERISDCIFRLQTGDRLLTNSFWNFYLYDSTN